MIPRRNSGNGMDLEKCRWIQTFGEIEITIPIKRYGIIKKEDVVINVAKNFIVVCITPHPPIIYGSLFGLAKANSALWALKESTLIVNFSKDIKMQEWTKLVQTDPDPTEDVSDTELTLDLTCEEIDVSPSITSTPLPRVSDHYSKLVAKPESSTKKTAISTCSHMHDDDSMDYVCTSNFEECEIQPEMMCTTSYGTEQPAPSITANTTTSVHQEDTMSSRKTAQLQRMNMSFIKWKSGRPLPSKCKQLITNVYVKLTHKHPNISDKDIIKMTSNFVGVGINSISKLKTELHRKGKTSTPGKKRLGRIGKYTRKQKYDEFTLSAIRRIVYAFFRQNEIPTVSKITARINDDPGLPNVRNWTTNRILHDLNFSFVRKKHKSILIDREDIVMLRRKYLRSIRQFREERRNIIYVDETWISENHQSGKLTEDHNIISKKDAQREDLTIGFKPPKGKGSRLIILHAGCASGFIPECLRIFHKKTGDYHDDMDGEYFRNWFESSLLPQLQPASVVILDNASYHSVRRDSFPTTHWLKSQIRGWLTDHGIEWEEEMVKQELINLAEPLRIYCEDYEIDHLAREKGHTILRLPPYHCELNPIEMVWSFIKGYVAQNNSTETIADVEKLTHDAFQKFTDSMWAKYIEHVIEVEDEMWELDSMMEDLVDKIVISDDVSDTETSSDTDSDLDAMQPI